MLVGPLAAPLLPAPRFIAGLGTLRIRLAASVGGRLRGIAAAAAGRRRAAGRLSAGFGGSLWFRWRVSCGPMAGAWWRGTAGGRRSRFVSASLRPVLRSNPFGRIVSGLRRIPLARPATIRSRSVGRPAIGWLIGGLSVGSATGRFFVRHGLAVRLRALGGIFRPPFLAVLARCGLIAVWAGTGAAIRAILVFLAPVASGP